MQRVTKLKVGDYVFIGIPQNGARPTPKDLKNDRLVAREIKSMHFSKSTPPYEHIRAENNTVTILESVLENTFSLDRVPKAPQAGALLEVLEGTQSTSALGSSIQVEQQASRDSTLSPTLGGNTEPIGPKVVTANLTGAPATSPTRDNGRIQELTE